MKYQAYCKTCCKNFDVDVSGTKMVFQVKCHNSHRHNFQFQGSLYEVMLDSACLSIYDGYYRSAILDCESAYERFREYFVKRCLIHQKIGKKSIKNLWQSIDNNSEAQIGAYNLLLTMNNIEIPNELNHERKRLRNKYLHGGSIPSKQDAIDYMNLVIETIAMPDKHLTSGNILDEMYHDLFYKKITGDLDIDENLPSITPIPTAFKDIRTNNYSINTESLIREVVHQWRGIEALYFDFTTVN